MGRVGAAPNEKAVDAALLDDIFPIGVCSGFAAGEVGETMWNVIWGTAMVIASITSASGQEPTPLNVAEWQSASEIIKEAKNEIMQSGWQQGAKSTVASNCAATALERSWAKLKKSMVDFDYARTALNHAIEAPPPSNLSDQNDPLAIPYWGRFYMYWNDAPGRTMEQVLSAFDSAAKYADEQKQVAEKYKKTDRDLEMFDDGMMRKLKFTK